MNTRTMLLPAMAVLLAAAAAAPAAADDTTTFTISVVDEARDRPVPKASVTVSFIQGRKLLVKKIRREWNTKTNTRGIAELPDIPEGRVKVQVIAAGFQTFGDEIDVAGNEQTLVVKLKKPSGGQFSAHEERKP